MIQFIERENLQEMAMASSRTDEDLIDIDIVVYSKEHPPKHATILKRSNHRVALGRFIITPNPPKSFQDIKEVKEPIDSTYKKELTAWAGKKNKIATAYTNWEFLTILWNTLNPTL
jgi:DUF438 domain-containing protein